MTISKLNAGRLALVVFVVAGALALTRKTKKAVPND